ncbi:hypothetical protein CBOM_07472 [Ceraceosorus bombacis]|uniref:Uncharacterized protein n=1 Tax=Ceraceosorus bombacis TaxID=401625 RepID=A0A0P1BAF4_9BASI|nr:hypothetical protein CBOM_07472 [Ceraceosorus bombacis]
MNHQDGRLDDSLPCERAPTLASFTTGTASTNIRTSRVQLNLDHAAQVTGHALYSYRVLCQLSAHSASAMAVAQSITTQKASQQKLVYIRMKFDRDRGIRTDNGAAFEIVCQARGHENTSGQ